jgi:vacuolar-type H+-ATPase subunit I/STV1
MAQLVEPYGSDCTLTRIEYLKAFTVKEKTIYQQLSLLNEFSNFVQGFAYIATEQCERTIQEIQSLSKPNQPSVQMISRQSKRPPTLFKTNSFTATAQEIVETYGTARYQ